MRVGTYKIVCYYIDTDEIPGFFQWRKFSIQWRYNFYLSHVKISRLSWLLQSQPIGNHHHSIARVYTFFIHKSVVLKNKIKFSNELPNFDINIFDDQQNERIGVRFVPMTDSEVHNFDQSGGKCKHKEKDIVRHKFCQAVFINRTRREEKHYWRDSSSWTYQLPKELHTRCKNKMAKSTNLLHLEEFCRVLSATYVAPAERDPVQVYKAYKDKRPENMLKPDSPLYFAVN